MEKKFFLYIDILGFENLPRNFAGDMGVDEDTYRKNFLFDPLHNKIADIVKTGGIINIIKGDGSLLIVDDDVQKVMYIVRQVTRIPFPPLDNFIPIQIFLGRKTVNEKAAIENGISASEVIKFIKESDSMDHRYRDQYKKSHGNSPIQTYILLSPEVIESDLHRAIIAPALSVADDIIISSWGWNEGKLFDKLMEIRNETIDGLISGYKGSSSQLLPMFKAHPDTWRLLLDEAQNIVGFWHFLPLSEEKFKICKDGKLVDDEIIPDDVRNLGKPGLYDIYIVSTCTKFQYCRIPGEFHFFNPYDVIQELPHKPGSNFLMDSMFKQIAELAHRGIFIRELCANAFTRSAIEACERFGLKYLKEHEAHGKIYAGSFISILECMERNPECNYFLRSISGLKELYEKAYNFQPLSDY